MAAFAAGLNGAQDTTGQVVTFTDESLYGALSSSNYSPANFNRSVVLIDAYGTQLAVLPFVGNSLTTQYAISTDQWIFAQLFLQGINPIPNFQTVQLAFPFDRITKNLYRTLLVPGCCSNKNVKEALDSANNYLLGAAIEALGGNGAGFNIDIQAANAYLSTPPY